MLIEKECGIRLSTVDSTNTYCRKTEVPSGYWVLAKEQTAGRGRNGRTWISLGQEKIFFSAKVSFSNVNFSIPLFSLLVGSAVLKSILFHFPDLKNSLRLKWPNDIYLNSNKVSGILIESEYIESNFVFIIGIGINLFGEDKIVNSDYLSEIPLGEEFREKLIYTLIEFMNEIEFILADQSLLEKEMTWILEKSYLQNKKVEFVVDNEKFSGNVLGYDRNGFLIIRKEDQTLVTLMDTGPGFKVIE